MKLVIFGINGKMGAAVVEAAAEKNIAIAAGFGEQDGFCGTVPVFSKVCNLPTTVNAAIDFSSPKLALLAAKWCFENKIPFISGTTGLSSEEQKCIEVYAQQIPVLATSNFSLGAAALGILAKMAAQILPNASCEIIELHHKHKIDAPSGTAKTLATKIASAREKQPSCITFGRCTSQKRAEDEICVHSVRGGTIVGEHQVLFAAESEQLILTHRAESRKIFAEGALECAKWLCTKQNGLFTVEDFLKSKAEVL